MKGFTFFMLSFIRLMMFVVLSSYFYLTMTGDPLYKKWYIFFAILLFTLNHFMQLFSTKKVLKIIGFLLDCLLAIGFALFFPESGYIYLIFFGVISTTVFLIFEKRWIRIFFLVFFLMIWLIVSWIRNEQDEAYSLTVNIINSMFVFYGAIVGNLIRILQEARETISRQYEQLNHSHLALQQAHEQLNQYSNQVEQMTIVRERNQIAREIHDTVGHKMTALIVQLQLARELFQLDASKSEGILSTCEQLSREALNELRLSVRTLHGESNLNSSFLPHVQALIDDFSKLTQMKITLEVVGDSLQIPISLQPMIKRILQEAMTNAKKHGAATACQIKLEIGKEQVYIEIQDNGRGVANFIPSFGLNNMKERILEKGGSFQVKSEPSISFTIFISLPIHQVQWIASGGLV